MKVFSALLMKDLYCVNRVTGCREHWTTWAHRYHDTKSNKYE